MDISYHSALHTNSFNTDQKVTVVDPIKRLPEVPAERTLKMIAGRWKASILYYLFDGPKRLSELKRLAPSASHKGLIRQLREMEEHGLVHREIFRQVPPRVDYTATALGLSLEPVILTHATGDAGMQPSAMKPTGSPNASLVSRLREPRHCSRACLRVQVPPNRKCRARRHGQFPACRTSRHETGPPTKANLQYFTYEHVTPTLPAFLPVCV